MDAGQREPPHADTAARLFAERGYEHVAVSDVAREAEVAEQTVCNYFRTKEQLVTDRDQQIQDRLCDLIRSRPSAITAPSLFASQLPPKPTLTAACFDHDRIILSSGHRLRFPHNQAPAAPGGILE
jgi:AcrR family transcriptional regulator